MTLSAVFVHRAGSQYASYRFRTEIPAEELRKLGHSIAINEGEGDTVVFSKPIGGDTDIAQKAKKDGARIITDLGDDHLTHPLIGPIYKDMMELSDVIVTPTKEMAERIYRVSGKLAEVIPDSYSQPQHAAHADGNALLWFGHKVNLKDLQPWLPCTAPWDFRAVSGPGDGNWIEWTPETMVKELAHANTVMVPMRKGAEYKSSHRLLDAVRAGCFVVASSHPAHDEFRKMLWIGHIKTGLEWARVFRPDLNALVTAAQEYVEAKYAPAVIGKHWEQVLCH